MWIPLLGMSPLSSSIPHLLPDSLLFVLHELHPLPDQDACSHPIPHGLLNFAFEAAHELPYVICVVFVCLLVDI